MNWTSDHSDLAERIATIDPAELHEAVVNSAIEALRSGAPCVALDGLEYWRMGDAMKGFTNKAFRRQADLEARLISAREDYDRARKNANTAVSPVVRDDFVRDAEAQRAEIDSLEARLVDDAERGDGPPSTFEDFDSDCDFLAHALAAILAFGERCPREVTEALDRVLEFTNFTSFPGEDPPVVRVEFCLLLPADGRVARFGPISCVVRNRAYRNTLRHNGASTRARALLTADLGKASGANSIAPPHQAAEEVMRQLMSQGWTRRAARTLVCSGVPALYAVAAAELWDVELPEGMDPAYVELVRATYGNPDFEWNPHRHSSDCSSRQDLVDAVVASGGAIDIPELEERLGATRAVSSRLNSLSRPQDLGGAPVWLPCLERTGNWVRQGAKAGRGLRTILCPHCGGSATKAVRTPETPDCVICPTCRRMPSPGSPVFSADYLDL